MLKRNKEQLQYSTSAMLKRTIAMLQRNKEQLPNKSKINVCSDLQ